MAIGLLTAGVDTADENGSFAQDVADTVNALYGGYSENLISDASYGMQPNQNNTALLQQLLDDAEGKTAVISMPHITSSILIVRTGTKIVFVGNGKITNTGGGSTLLDAVFMVGHWHPAFYGSKPIGDPNPYNRLVDRYQVAAIALNSNSVTCSTPANAANFVPDEIYAVCSQESISQTSTGVDIELPLYSSLVKVKSVNAATGVVQFYDDIGFSTATTAFILKIKDDALSQGIKPYIPKDIELHNANGAGHSMFGLSSTCYNLKVNNWSGDFKFILQVNGFCKSILRGFTGTFQATALELKWCAKDTIVSEIVATSDIGATTGIGIISLGEGARNVTIKDFDLSAPKYRHTGSIPIVNFNDGFNNVIEKGTIFTPTADAQMVQFYAGEMPSLDACQIRDVMIYSASRLGIRFGATTGTNKPTNCKAIRVTMVTSYSLGATMFLCRTENSFDCAVENCDSPNLTTIEFTSGATRPIARGNRVATGGGVIGTNGKAVGARDNFTAYSGTTNVPIGVGFIWSTVTPEGNVTADAGSYCAFLSGGNATLWFKATGATNTGWVAK